MRSLAVALAFVIGAGGACADDRDVAAGRGLYRDFCAGCHGSGARGDGPLAAPLKLAAADLTGLAQRNDGVFPTLDVIQAINGCSRFAGHGQGMPAFQALFARELGPLMSACDAAAEAQLRALELVFYLQSIQAR
jgi:mono/diheme cytochrome c family protein